MKIRNGFVTNSSSTSFIISLKDKWEEKNFLNSLGATGESPMNKLFIDLFETVNDKKEDLLSAAHNCGEQKTVEEFLTEKGFEKILNDYRITENINALIFLNYKPVGRILKRPLEHSKQLTNFLSNVISIKNCQIGFDSCMICHLVDYKELIDERSFDFCEAGRFSAFVSEEGEMYPCSFMCGAGIKGYNLRQNSMEHIWKNAPLFVLQRKKISSVSEGCKDCMAQDLCRGGCPFFEINKCKNKEKVDGATE